MVCGGSLESSLVWVYVIASVYVAYIRMVLVVVSHRHTGVMIFSIEHRKTYDVV